MICKSENDGCVHIRHAADEKEEDVLRAIAKASFALACPFLLVYSNVKDCQGPCDGLSDKEFDSFVFPNDNHEIPGSSIVVFMDIIRAHRCKTIIHKVEDRHFILDKSFFERDRGAFDIVVELANLMLSTGEDWPDFPNADFSLRGKNLDIQAHYLGFSRKEEESDFEFRKRLFLEITLHFGNIRGTEFLFGSDDFRNAAYLVAKIFIHTSENKNLSFFKAQNFMVSVLLASRKKSRELMLEALDLLPGDPIALAKEYFKEEGCEGFVVGEDSSGTDKPDWEKLFPGLKDFGGSFSMDMDIPASRKKSDEDPSHSGGGFQPNS